MNGGRGSLGSFSLKDSSPVIFYKGRIGPEDFVNETMGAPERRFPSFLHSLYPRSEEKGCFLSFILPKSLLFSRDPGVRQ